MDLETTASHVVDAAVRLHIRLGPGLLESVYTRLLARELRARSLKVESEKAVSFDFDGIHFRDGFRVDLLVNDRLVVELKSVDALAAVHSKQVLTYLRLMGLPLGLLINFGGETLKAGLRRIVNGYGRQSAPCP